MAESESRLQSTLTRADRWIIAIGGPVIAGLLIWVGASVQQMLTEQTVIQYQLTQMQEHIEDFPPPAELEHELDVIHSDLDHHEDILDEHDDRLDRHEELIED